MDLSMNDDEIITNDEEVIKTYLNHRIDELKLLTDEAKLDLEERKAHRENCMDILKNEENFGNTSLCIKKYWKKIYNEKLVIGINTEMEFQRSSKNVAVIMKCDAINPLDYAMKIYTQYQPEKDEEIETLSEEEDIKDILNIIQQTFVKKPKNIPGEWMQTNELKNKSTIIILIDLPTFLDTQDVKFNGIILFERAENKFQVTIEDLSLSVHDVIDDKYAINTTDVINGKDEDYLSIISTGIVTPVQIKIPEGIYRSLEGLLQLDCFFTKVSTPGNYQVLIFDGKSQSLTDALLKVVGERDVVLITKNNIQLNLLLHHIYKYIPDVVIYNEECEYDENSFCTTRPTQSFRAEPRLMNQDALKEFVSSVDKQIQLVEKTFVNAAAAQKQEGGLNIIDIPSEEYKIFRKELSDMEKKTDILFLNLNEN